MVSNFTEGENVFPQYLKIDGNAIQSKFDMNFQNLTGMRNRR